MVMCIASQGEERRRGGMEGWLCVLYRDDDFLPSFHYITRLNVDYRASMGVGI